MHIAALRRCVWAVGTRWPWLSNDSATDDASRTQQVRRLGAAGLRRVSPADDDLVDVRRGLFVSEHLPPIARDGWSASSTVPCADVCFCGRCYCCDDRSRDSWRICIANAPLLGEGGRYCRWRGRGVELPH